MARKLTLELPDSLEMDEKELMMMLAAHLYGDGKLSMGHAAEIAGVSKRTLMENLGKYGVPVYNYGAEGMKNEFREP